MPHPPIATALSAVLVACVASSATTATEGPPTDPTESTLPGTPATDPTSPWTPTTPDPDLVAIEAALQTLVEVLPWLTPAPCFDAYQEVVDDQDPACPAYTRRGPIDTWIDVCVSEQGTLFFGGLNHYDDVTALAEDRLLDEWLVPYGPTVVPGWIPPAHLDGLVTGEAMESQATVTARSDEWQMNADAYGFDVRDGELAARYLALHGTCEWTWPTGSGWVDLPLAPWLDAIQIWAIGGGARRAWYDGAVDGLTTLSWGERAAPYDTAEFIDVALSSRELSACWTEPSGRIEVRDDGGHRYAIDFDPELVCDGCGTVSAPDGRVFGQVCTDFGQLLEPLPRTPGR
ncbi:MAG: hypothetical protein H6735_33200 [Alphaproteobacteria bacterium]|nr:hypothetical protein [Alphaproteobacteria bacterium]